MINLIKKIILMNSISPYKKFGLLIVLLVSNYRCTGNEDERIYNELMSKALIEKSTHPEIKIFDGDVEPDMPDRKVNDSTLYGVDANRNELRDDVEIWINRTYKDQNIRMAFKQKHKVFQRIMKAKIGDSSTSNKLIQEEYEAVQCAVTYFKTIEDFDKHDLKAIILTRNNSSRNLHYSNVVYHVNVPIGGPGLDNGEQRKRYCNYLQLPKE